MEIAFLIPTKDGGEGFLGVFESIERNIENAFHSGFKFEYRIIFALNGEVKRPLAFLNEILQKPHVEVQIVNRLGKVQSINSTLERLSSDFLVISDDDVTFDDDLLARALQNLIGNKDLQIVGFQNQATSYCGRNVFRRFLYDIINARSLGGLFEGIDPFLMGRLLVMKRTAWNVPNGIINEDQYLSLAHDGKYEILSGTIFYEGVSSIQQHIRRVLRLEAGRKQLSQLFEDVCKEEFPVTRTIDRQKLSSLGLYRRVCYHLYGILRFFTNKIVPIFTSHKTNYW